MVRASIVALVIAFAASAAAEEEPAAPRRDPFVMAPRDACGASQYQHLIERPLVQVQQAALLPSSANLVDRGGVMTLEYSPARLNVVVDPQGRIIAISCF
jgi:hypothetical protein